MHLQPLRRPDVATDYFSNQRHQSERFAYPSADLPYADYAAGRQYQVCINNIAIYIFISSSVLVLSMSYHNPNW